MPTTGLPQFYHEHCSSQGGHNVQESPVCVLQLEHGGACCLLLTFQFSEDEFCFFEFLMSVFSFYRTTFVLHSRKLTVDVQERPY